VTFFVQNTHLHKYSLALPPPQSSAQKLGFERGFLCKAGVRQRISRSDLESELQAVFETLCWLDETSAFPQT
jgi:hypothetical protein